MITTGHRATTLREVAIHPATAGPVLATNADRDCALSEQYRIIRTRLLQHSPGTRMLLVSSAAAGDGKTVTSINLAAALAWRNMKVLLLDADLRKASISATLNIPNSPGIGEVLTSRSTLVEAIVCVQQNPNLHILPAGARTGNPAEQLDSQVWLDLCAAVREEFDYVVVDAPPVDTVADYELLQSVCDSVVIVVRPDHTPREALSRVLTIVPEHKLVGAVMNATVAWPLQTGHRAYRYYTGQFEGGERAPASPESH